MTKPEAPARNREAPCDLTGRPCNWFRCCVECDDVICIECWRHRDFRLDTADQPTELHDVACK